MGELEKRFRIREPVSVFRTADKKKIHESALQVLERTGMRVHSDVARADLKKAGATVDEKAKVVKLPRDLVKSLLRTVPGTVTLAGRTEECDLPLDGAHYYITTDGCGIQAYDTMKKTRRASILEDIRRTAIIADWLPYLSIYEPMVVAHDVPAKLHVLMGFKEAVENTTKHIETESTTTPEEAEAQVKMAAEVVGSREELRKRHYISAMVCTMSPLILEGGATDATMVWAENHVPIHICGMAMMGMSGPATVAGDLVVNHAETLGLACAMQAHEPGAPLLYGSVLSSMDLRTGAFSSGSPEAMQLAMGAIEMARFMKWPCSAGGIGSGALVPGIQAAVENSLMAMSAAMAGSEVMNGIGLLDGSTVLAYEQLLIDNEMVGMTLGVSREVGFGSEELALDVIEKVGIGGMYLGQRHTARHARDFHQQSLWSREQYDSWEKKGKKDLMETAREKVDKILKEHTPHRLSREVSAGMEAVIRDFEKSRR